MSPSTKPEPSLERSWRNRQLIWILLLAFLLRLVWATLVEVIPVSDSHAYDVFARNLLDYGVYGWTADQPFAFWPPGTSILYAAVYKLFGVKFFNIAMLNIALSCALIVTSSRIASRFYNDRVSVFTATILAVWPTLVMFTTVLASELPFLFLTISALDVWTSEERSWVFRGVFAGLLLGFASLVRPLALALPFVYGGSLALQGVNLRNEALRQIRPTVACFVVMLAVIAPWTWRNYLLYGEPVLVSTNGGATLWMGNAPGTNGGYLPIPDRLDSLNDNERDKVLGEEARRFILNDPLGFILRSSIKLVRLYNNESIGVIWNERGIENQFGPLAVMVLKRFTQISWAIILSLAAFGMYICFRLEGWRALLSPIAATIIFYSATNSVIVSQDRYHLAFAAQIALLAGISLARFSSWKEIPELNCS
jgi:hypothetical protein